MCGLVSDLAIYMLEEYDGAYDTEYPFWHWASLNNIKFNSICSVLCGAS